MHTFNVPTCNFYLIILSFTIIIIIYYFIYLPLLSFIYCLSVIFLEFNIILIIIIIIIRRHYILPLFKEYHPEVKFNHLTFYLVIYYFMFSLYPLLIYYIQHASKVSTTPGNH